MVVALPPRLCPHALVVTPRQGRGTLTGAIGPSVPLSGVGFANDGTTPSRGDKTPLCGASYGRLRLSHTPKEDTDVCHPRVTEWTTIIQTHLPHLSKPQATVLALWSLGMVLAAPVR